MIAILKGRGFAENLVYLPDYWQILTGMSGFMVEQRDRNVRFRC